MTKWWTGEDFFTCETQKSLTDNSYSIFFDVTYVNKKACNPGIPEMYALCHVKCQQRQDLPNNRIFWLWLLIQQLYIFGWVEGVNPVLEEELYWTLYSR